MGDGLGDGFIHACLHAYAYDQEMVRARLCLLTFASAALTWALPSIHPTHPLALPHTHSPHHLSLIPLTLSSHPHLQHPHK